MKLNNVQLNPEQLKAVNAINGPVLVLAGAGSGKTRVLTNRIAYMVNEKAIDPSNILAITFTNKAANEMKSRLMEMDCCADRMTISTIHALCARILRYDGDKLNYKPNFSIYDEQDSERVLKTLYAKHFIDDDKVKKIIARHISNAKMYGMTADEYEKSIGGDHCSEACEILTEYDKALFDCNAMDFDDLLLNVYRLFKDNPTVLNYYQEKFKYISIDEFQDTNRVQYDIFKMLASKYRNLFVVGDDDQSIYGWRGADVNNILFFTDDYPDAQIFKLEQNYRSTQKILNVANEIISKNEHRHEKKLWTDNDGGVKVEMYSGFTEGDEAYYVVSQIASLVNARNAHYSEFAVLMRINALSRSFEQECMKYGIPTKVFGGFKFFERKEIKDLTSYIKAVVNPYDNEAFLRIINTPKRGIGDSTQQRLVEMALDAGVPLSVYISDPDNLEEFSPTTRKRVGEFFALYSNLTDMAGKYDTVTFVKKMIDLTGFRESLLKTDEEVERAVNIDQFIEATQEFCRDNPEATIAEYLQSVTLTTDLDIDSDGKDYLTLATVHSAKGLEFDNVFVVGMDEGIFPISRAAYDDKEMQEERRLMYVAITRAKKRLYLTRSKSRFLYGERKPTAASRFYKEIEQMFKVDTPVVLDKDGVPVVERRTFGRRQFTPRIETNIGKYKVGDVVSHSTFGEGIILNITGENAEVVFSNGVGKKALALKYAPLTIIKSK